jgi:transcriptional regulator with XRE-family HTH domain
MESLSKAFLVALKLLIDGRARGQKVALARKAGVSPSLFNDILASRKYGSEETRRAIAAALGYPGRKYEDFLDIGRKTLGSLEAAADESAIQPRVFQLISALNQLEEFELSIVENLLTVFSKIPKSE